MAKKNGFWAWLIRSKGFYMLLAFFIFFGHTLNYPNFRTYISGAFVGALAWAIYIMAIHYYIVIKYKKPKYVVALIILVSIMLPILIF